MKIFRYPEDRIPVLCIAGLSICDFAVYLTVNHWAILLGWFLMTLGPKACICAWNHHHQHVATFIYTPLNRMLELLYAFHTGITTNAWVLHHNLGHHINYLDQSLDESAWQRKDGSTMGTTEYTLTIAITGYPRAFGVGQQYPKHQRPFLTMGFLVILLTMILVWFNPTAGIIVYVCPMVAGLLITSWHTYYHHAGLDTKNHLEASYNITHRWYNILTGNLGYHTAHHMKQGLHWSRLPEYHASIADGIPHHLYRSPCIPFRWIPDKSNEMRHEHHTSTSRRIDTTHSVPHCK